MIYVIYRPDLQKLQIRRKKIKKQLKVETELCINFPIPSNMIIPKIPKQVQNMYNLQTI